MYACYKIVNQGSFLFFYRELSHLLETLNVTQYSPNTMQYE